MIPDLIAFYRFRARLHMRRSSQRLRRGQGVGGRRLRQKVEPDGRPLGGRVARSLLRGRVIATQNGFSISYSGQRDVVGFDEGHPDRGQLPRPIVGITRQERRRIFLAAREEAIRQLNQGVR